MKETIHDMILSETLRKAACKSKETPVDIYGTVEALSEHFGNALRAAVRLAISQNDPDISTEFALYMSTITFPILNTFYDDGIYCYQRLTDVGKIIINKLCQERDVEYVNSSKLHNDFVIFVKEKPQH